MTGLYIMFAGFVLFATFVGVWDFFAERQADRAARNTKRTGVHR